MAVTAVAAVLMALGYLLLAGRTYEARARILVLQQGGQPLNVAQAETNRPVEGGEDYLQTHLVILRSPLVVKSAIDAAGLENLPTLLAAQRKGRDPVEAAVERLDISRPERLAKVLRIAYHAPSPDEAVRMVEALLGAYRRFLEEGYQRNSEVIALIVRARSELGQELDDLERKYLEFRQKNPVLATDEKGHPFIRHRLGRWDRAVAEAMVREVQLKAQLELARKLSQKGVDLWAVAHAMNQLGTDSNGVLVAYASVGTQQGGGEYVRQLRQEQQQLADRFGPQYAKVRELDEQIARAQERIRGGRDRADQGEVGELIGALEQGVKASEAMRAEIAKRIEQDTELARRAEADLIAEANLRGNLERRRALFNGVADQLKQAQFAREFSQISFRTIEAANAAPGAVSPRWSSVLALALVLGGLLGGAFSLAAAPFETRAHGNDETSASGSLLDWRPFARFVVSRLPLVPRRTSGARQVPAESVGGSAIPANSA